MTKQLKKLGSLPTNLLTCKCRTAFTLAEVLITLGVIGVVAAMTMPILIQNHKKKTTITQIKRTVNVIQNAKRMAFADGLQITPNDINNLEQFFVPYMNVIKKCENGETDCGLTDILCLHKGDKGLSLSSSAKRYILNDGTFVSFRSLSSNQFMVYFDINGHKGPNVMGYDVFALPFEYDQAMVDFRNFRAPANYTSRFINDGQGCNDSHSNNGLYCLWRIMTDQYNINYW